MNRTSAVENSFLAFCTRSQRLGAIWAVQAIASRIDGDCGGWTFLEALQILRLMGARRPLALKGPKFAWTVTHALKGGSSTLV